MTRQEILSINPYLISWMDDLNEEEITIAVETIKNLSVYNLHENKGKFMESILSIKDDENRNKLS